MSAPENPAAFPCTGEGFQSERYTQKGMTLRDWFAGQVMPIIAADLAQDRNDHEPSDLPRLTAVGCYMYADAMLTARTDTGRGGGK